MSREPEDDDRYLWLGWALVVASLLGILGLLLWSSHAQAAPPAPTPCTASQSLPAGTVSPCSGVLSPLPIILACIDLARVELPGCRAEVALRVGERDAAEAARVAEAGAARQIEDAYVVEVLRLRRVLRETVAPVRAWYESPWFGAAVGAVAAGGLAVVVVVVRDVVR